MRQATEFQPEPWETIGGVAEIIRRSERAGMGRISTVAYHTGISKEQSQRGRDNALKVRRDRMH